MKTSVLNIVFLVIVTCLTSISTKIQAQSFLFRPYVHSGYTILTDMDLKDLDFKLDRLNYGVGVQWLIGLGTNKQAKLGQDLGWGKLYNYKYDEFDTSTEKESSIRILFLFEYSTDSNISFFQIGAGIHTVLWKVVTNIPGVYNDNSGSFNLDPCGGIMFAYGISVLNSKKISMPISLRVDCITNTSDLYVTANISIGVTFK